MTPKFKYDPQQHCLREVARVKEPLAGYYKNMSHYWEDLTSYEQHLASLRVIPCAPDTKWPEGVLIQGTDFEIRMGWHEMGAPVFAFPITPPPRTFTLAEALEIWDGGWNAAIYYSIHDEENITKQQYFKTRFNEDI